MGTCTKTCGGGTMKKGKICKAPTDNNGATCYEDCKASETMTTESCNNQNCPFNSKKNISYIIDTIDLLSILLTEPWT